MESDFQHHHPHHLVNHYQQQQQNQKQLNSGLTRYQSAPSSLFSSLLDREFCEEFFNRPSSPETERIFARFLSSGGGAGGANAESFSDAVSQNSPEKVVEVKVEPQTQMMAPAESETGVMQQQQQQQQPPPQQGNYSSASQNFYQSQPPQSLHNQNSSSAMEYNVASSIGMDRLPPTKTGGRGNSSLIRHSSSPAGLFANLHVDHGYGVMRNMGDFGGGKTENIESTFRSANRPPPSPLLDPIPEIRNKNLGPNSSDNPGFRENRQNSYSSAGFPTASWEESTMMSDNMTRRLGEEDRTLSSETQNVDTGNRPPPILAHHLSLQKTSVEMSALENFLQFQESVPCKIRAKRGCATHPRSIAERVRRTKISERMRKLQDLVPNMDKQTSTADMLDLAVEYIKDLQEQVKTLSDSRAKCRCGNGNK